MHRPPAIKEQRVLIECRALLDYFKHRGLLDYWRVHTGGIVTRGKFLVPNKEMVGFSDIIILTPQPLTIFLELKGEAGRQSPGQKAFQARTEAMNHKYYLCKGRSELCEILKSNGIQMGTFIK